MADTATQQTVLEAAKMLKELQEQTLNNIRYMNPVPENIFKLSGFHFTGPNMATTSARGDWFIDFAINGKVYNLNGNYSYLDIPSVIVKDVLKAIKEQIQDIIVSEVGKTLQEYFNL